MHKTRIQTQKHTKFDFEHGKARISCVSGPILRPGVLEGLRSKNVLITKLQ